MMKISNLSKASKRPFDLCLKPWQLISVAGH